jgi:hypothetical protein
MKYTILLLLLSYAVFGQEMVDFSLYNMTKHTIKLKTKNTKRVIEYDKAGYSYYFDFYIKHLKKYITVFKLNNRFKIQADGLDTIKKDTINLGTNMDIDWKYKDFMNSFIPKLCLRKRFCLKAQNPTTSEKQIYINNYVSNNTTGCVLMGKFFMTKETNTLLFDVVENRVLVRRFAK